jgi:glucose-1-phosphate thymidylyltransferase
VRRDEGSRARRRSRYPTAADHPHPFTSVAENCRIADSELEFSIVLRESSIEGVGRIEESLIGRHVEVTPAPVVPGAHRLVLGDHSKVQIHT